MENKVLYLDEQFGERQISCYQSHYTGGYVSKDAEGAHAYGDEAGAYKVSFDGVTPTQYNEGLLTMDVPAIIDLTEYEEIYLYVYNASDNDIIMGSQWWNDTSVKKGEWTRLRWNTREWGNNMSGNNTKPIGTLDITGMTIRFIFDYAQKVIPNGDFYLSAMYGTPKIESEIEIGEHVDIASGKYYINDVIELNAEEIEGKTVDCFKVDGEIIAGTSFTVTQEKHKIEVVYVDGELSKDNMTWVDIPELKPAGDDVQTQYVGTDDYWVMSYDVYGMADGWKYFGVYVGGTTQLLGFEIVNSEYGKLSGYGGAWKWGEGIRLTSEQINLLRSATEENPVKTVYVRRGGEIRVFLLKGEETYFIGAVEFSQFGIAGDNFGFGRRKPGDNLPEPPTIKNFMAVAGETKTNIYFEDFSAEFTIDGEKVDGSHYIGDKVTLKVGEAPAGKLFAYFTVNGERLYANEFRIASADTKVVTVYTDAVTVVLGDGIKTEDGKTGEVVIAKETYIVLEYTGATPPGKYYVGFTVDGVEIIGNEVYITDATEIDVLFADKLETGGEKLNEITGDVIYALKDDGETVKWNPSSVEHVTDFMFTGSDGAVDENSVLKVVTGNDSGENSFAFNSALVDDLDAYKEIYFYVYTEAKGLKAGGWWCGDTELVAGKWTKVSFGRNPDLDKTPGTIIGNGEAKVWEEGISKFAFRIFSAPANTTVYVTAVYGLPYEDAKVTANSGVTVSEPKNGESYKVGETVTLTAGEAPEGNVFAYFTANGEPIEGNQYLLTGEVVFGVVYNEFSTISLAEGIKTADGHTGSVKVARNMPVYLKLTDDTKYYLAFYVDGEAITGNSFTPTEGKTYTVTVKTENRVASLNEQVNTVSSSAMHDGDAKLGFTQNISYNGVDGAVKENGILKISEIGSGDVSVKSIKNVGEKELLNYAEVYFYIYTEADGVKAGTWWCNDTAAVKGQWTKVTVYADASKNVNGNNPYEADGVKDKLFAKGSYGSNFIYRIMGAEGKTVYITSLYGVAYKDATVKIAEDSKDTLTVSAPANGTNYKEGETVNLTAAKAPAGTAFAYFTANGKRIDGNTYLLTTEEVVFGVVYSEISTVTLGEGVNAENEENGELTVGRGATVHLQFIGEVPSGKYFKGFEVDGELIEGDSFIAEDAEHTVIALFEDRIQTGNEKLNEISTVEEDGLSYHPAQTGWRPEKIEYVTDVKYTGSDGAIDESGSLKVTLSGNEQAFALNKTLINKLDGYEEIFFYIYADKDTEVNNVSVGGWWCRDTKLVAGEWTKVSFTRKANPQNISEKSVWDENNIERFVYSINGAKAGTVVYVTAVYGVPYGEVSVTVEEGLEEYIKVDGTFREGQTITLSNEGAPEGKAFAYFTINGEKYDETTYTLGKEAVVIGAVFSEISKVSLGAGVTADGVEGANELTVGRGKTITLIVDGTTAPANKVFDCFAVDGKAISGNKFTTTLASHSVTAIFIDDVKDMTWNETEYEEPDGTVDSAGGVYKKLGSDANWALSYDLISRNPDSESNKDIPNQWYAGVLFRNNVIIGYEMGEHAIKNYLGSGGDTWDKMQPNLGSLTDILNGASAENPVTLTFLRQGNALSAYITSGGTTYIVIKDKIHEAFDTAKGLDFGYGWRTNCGGTPDIENIKWVTGEGKVGLYTDSLKANISVVGGSTEENEYHLGDTVTLIADAAEEGKKFLHFTVNGEPIEGNTFVVSSTEKYEVAVEYSDISTLTLENGVLTADGETEYARGAKVTLSFDASKLNGKILDYFIIDEGEESEQIILNGEFTTTNATHTVKAVLAEVGSMTWEDVEFKQPDGGDAQKAKVGSGKYWAFEYDFYGVAEGNIYAGVYVGGNDQVFGFQLDADEQKLGGYGGSWKQMTVCSLIESQINALRGATAEAPVKLTFIRNGDDISAYLNGEFVGRTSFAGYLIEGDDFGFGTRNNYTIGTLQNIKVVTDKNKVKAYADYIFANSDIGPVSGAQLTYVGNSKNVSNISDMEYVTDKKYDGNDVNVTEKGSLKVTVSGTDCGFAAVRNFALDLSAYSEVYFYVYTEVENAGSGAYWCGDTELVAGKWTKVSLNAGMASGGPWNIDGSRIFESGLKDMVVRLNKCNSGDVFYVTSLYGVRKDSEPLIENGATDYSVVSGNEELSAIIYENFFQDAE